MNPFLTNKQRYLDNYARSMAENMPGATRDLATPQYGQISQTGQKSTAMPTGMKPLQTKGPRSDLDRLQAEKNELLDAGCYTEDDPLIQEMDRQIAQAMAKLNLLTN